MHKLKLIVFLSLIQISLLSQSSWYLINSGTSNGLKSIDFVNESTGYICGNNSIILKTTNAGINWTNCSPFVSGNLESIFAVDNNNLYCVGTSGVILKSTNSGINWDFSNSGTNVKLTKCFFLNKDTGFVVGDSSIILKTVNGGMNWFRLFSGNSDMNSTYWLNYQIGFVVYTQIFPPSWSASIIAKTTNSGNNWNSVAGLTGQSINDLTFVNNYIGIAVGGSIGITLNQGSNWSFIPSGFSFKMLVSVFFCNENTGYSVGYTLNATNEYILKTTNQGHNWVRQTFTYNIYSCTDVCFVNLLTGYVTCPEGKILKTTNGGEPLGIQIINNEIPNQFFLLQNYPNPFNPTTKIRFDIPHLEGARGRVVRVAIYDLLGREDAALVNEQLSPGTYEVEWDGTNLPSGTYFYRFESGSYSETKKMILLK